MSQQIKQKFKRTAKVQSNRTNLLRSYGQLEMVRNSLTDKQIITSPKKSQLSIDSTYRFDTNKKKTYQNPRTIHLFQTKIKMILLRRQLDTFYKIKLLKLEKQRLHAAIPFFVSIQRSIVLRQKHEFFMRLKLNSRRFDEAKTTAKNIENICKRRSRQNLTFALTKLMSCKYSTKTENPSQMGQKPQLLSLRNQHPAKVISTLSEMNSSQSKRQSSSRSMQKQSQFYKFTESIENNLTKQRDHQLAKINIVNLVKKFKREDKFKDQIRVYEIMCQLISQAQKTNNSIKQSSVMFTKMVSFLDPLNPAVSIANAKQIRKQITLLRNKLQPFKRPQTLGNFKEVASDNNRNISLASRKTQQPTFFENIQKVTDLISSLFEQLSLKNAQKSRIQQEFQARMLTSNKQDSQLQKKIQQYQQNEALCESISQAFPDTQLLSRQLTDINRKFIKRKNQFPLTLFTKMNDFLTQHKKSVTQTHLALKNVASLYVRKNVTNQVIAEQKARIAQKYSSNQLFASLQPQICILVQSAVQKQRQMTEVQMSKLTKQIQKLTKQLQDQRIRIEPLDQKAAAQSNIYINKSVPLPRQNTRSAWQQQISQMTASLKVKENKVKQLQGSIEDYEKTSFQNDLVKETLLGLLQKVQSRDQTWLKDVQVLRKGRNKAKYELIYKITDIIKPIVEYNRTFGQSFDTLIYNSKRQSHSQKQLLQIRQYPNSANHEHPVHVQAARMSQRISWDLTMNPLDFQPKQTNSFMIEDNLLDESSILGMKESNLLADTLNVKNDSPVMRLQLLLNPNPQQQQSSRQDSVISTKQVQQMNQVLIKVMNQQFQAHQITKNQLTKLTNPYLANFVILVQSYLAEHQKLNQLYKQKQDYEVFVRDNQINSLNERLIKQFLALCSQDLDSHSLKLEESYWDSKLNQITQPSILMMQLTNLFKRISNYSNNLMALQKTRIQSHDLVNYEIHAPLQWLSQRHSLQEQIQRLKQIIAQTQRAVKQSQLKHNSQLVWQQGIEQKPRLSAQDHNQQSSAQSKRSRQWDRTGRQWDRASRSLKQIQASEGKSHSSNKLKDVRNQLKESIQEYSIQQKKLLQKIQQLNGQKEALHLLIHRKQTQLGQLSQRAQHLWEQLSQGRRRQSEMKAKSQSDFDSLRRDLDLVKLQVAGQVQRKQQQVQYYRQAYDILAQKYTQLSSNYQQKTAGHINQPQVQQLSLQTHTQSREQFQQRVLALEQTITKLQRQNQQLRKQSHAQIQRVKGQIVLYQQKQSNLQLNQNNQKQDSGYNNKSLKGSSLKQMHTSTKQDIQKVDQNTYVITQMTTTTGQMSDMRQIDEVQELRMRLGQMQQQRNYIIQNEVLKALKQQEDEFNAFFQENIQKMQEHYVMTVIPQRLHEAQVEFAKLYSHNAQSTVTQITTSSATNIPLQLNQEALVSQKCQQWKQTYLPGILQLKQKQWLQQYEQTQLQEVLQKKYQEWQSIRLVSVMKQQRNQWILQELFTDRIKEWTKHQEEVLNSRTRLMEEYYERTIFPERLKQWQSTIVSSVTVTGTHYSQADIQRMLAEEQAHWKSTFEGQLEVRTHQIRQQYEHKIIPQIIEECRNEHKIIPQMTQEYRNEQSPVQKLAQSNQLPQDHIQQIIKAKYQQWKHTYLVQYLRLQKQRWLQQFKKTQLQVLIKEKYQQWESLRLLAIVKQPKNHWIFQDVIREKNIEWERKNQQLWVRRQSQFQIQWETKQLQERKQWESTTLAQERKQWETKLLQEKKEWESQFLLMHPQKQPQIREVVKQVVTYAQVNIDDQIKKHELIWRHSHEQQSRVRLQQLQKKWQQIISGQRQVFEQNLQSSLQLRTTQVENYWQSFVLPQLRSEWQQSYLREHSPQVLHNSQHQEQKVSMLTNQHIDQQQRSQLTRTIQQQKQQWHNNFMSTQLIQILHQKQEQWHHQSQHEFTDKLNSILLQQRQKYQQQVKQLKKQLVVKSNVEQYLGLIGQFTGRLQQLQMQHQQLQKQHQQLQKQHQQLQKQHQQLQMQHQQLQGEYHSLRSSKAQSISNKEEIYRLQSSHLKQNSQMKSDYEQRLSQLAHEKSLLVIQLKQIQISMAHKSKPAKEVSVTNIHSNYEKQFLSLQATIKTKQSQVSFLKKSLNSSSLDNQQLNVRIMNLNHKVSTLQSGLDEIKNQSIKSQYQIKYLKQKQSTYIKKLQSKQSQFSQYKSREQLQKSLLQKKIRQLASSSQSLSSLQIKISQLQSQLSLKITNIKSVENQVQRKRRELQEERQRSLSYQRDSQLYRTTIKQLESVVQDLRLQIRKSCDESNRQKLILQSFQQKERSHHEQLKRLQTSSRNRSQLQEIIRENQRLRGQNYRVKQRLVFMQSNQSKQMSRLRETVHLLQMRLRSQVHHYREGDYTEIQVLKRINHQISDLVSSNKQLQMRIIVLENEKQLSAFGISIERFFVAFQQQMDNLINYLISNQIFTTDSFNLYNKFQQKSREALSHAYVQDYFRQWQAFIRGAIEQNYEQITKSTGKNTSSERSQEQAEQIIEKYDTVLNDVKFTLSEFLKTGEQQYLTMMSKSLGLQIQHFAKQQNEANHTQQRTAIQQQTLTRQ